MIRRRFSWQMNTTSIHLDYQMDGVVERQSQCRVRFLCQGGKDRRMLLRRTCGRRSASDGGSRLAQKKLWLGISLEELNFRRVSRVKQDSRLDAIARCWASARQLRIRGVSRRWGLETQRIWNCSGRERRFTRSVRFTEAGTSPLRVQGKGVPWTGNMSSG